MPVAYPFELRTFIREGKSRSQPASFRVAQPRRGFGYIDPIGTDTPVFWDVTFRFDACDAIRFRMWFVIDLERGVLDFTIPVRTEFGLQTYTLRFLDDALLDAREIGEVWEYKARVMARAEVIPAAAVTAYAATFSGPIPDQFMAVGADFSLSLASFWTAGVGPYTYAIAAGALPPGLFLNETTGVVSGLPTVAGEFPGVVFERRDVYCAEIKSNEILFQTVTSSLVTALLNGEGTEGGTTFVDSSLLANVCTGQTSTTTSSALGVAAGTRAIRITGTGQTKGVFIAGNAANNMGAGPWTVECYATAASDSGLERNIFYLKNAAETRSLRVYQESYLSGNRLRIQFQHSGSGTTALTTQDIAVAAGTRHVCVMREGTFLGIFVAGVQIFVADSGTGQPTLTDNFDFSGDIEVGGSRGWDGAIDCFRLTKKRIYSTAGFTPPTGALSPIVL